jgi:hypothetical protein
MVERHVRVYIEGGARGRVADNDFRKGWKKFLRELHELAREHGYAGLEPVRGLGRGNAFRRFKKHMLEYPDDLCVLLVDAETVVPKGTKVWDVVAKREGDKWERPPWATEDQLYLMVHFVETWLIADHEALSQFFKHKFNASCLPKSDLENLSKKKIEDSLKEATNGAYQHGLSHRIVELVRPTKIKELDHGERLFKNLAKLIVNEAK